MYGKLCWQVEQGYGSFLTFEFGVPHLHIREPRKATKQAPESVRKNAARRHVYVHGDWHFWVYLCDWRISSQGQLLADHTSTRRTIKKATTELNGQALVQLTVEEDLISVLEFDLGGKLEIIPNAEHYDKTADLWFLYEPNGDVFTLRADGYYCHHPGNWKPEENIWQPLLVKKNDILHSVQP